jgi:thioredoxin reductase (NADPH)
MIAISGGNVRSRPAENLTFAPEIAIMKGSRHPERPAARPRTVAVMVKPVFFVVGDEAGRLRSLAEELKSRYGSHYSVVVRASAADALAGLGECREAGTAVALVLADQGMPAMTGIELLSRVRELYPTTRRGLLIAWGDQSSTGLVLRAAALGQIDFYVPTPAWAPDEQFHLAVTESLDQWWRQRGGRFEAVTVVGAEPHARSHEIRDVLARNSVPFGFHRNDSPEGRALLDRLGVEPDHGPVVALYNGAVLVDPTNAEVAQALGAQVRPADQTYDVLIIGAGPAGLAGAVYGSSEGLNTAVLEREAFGGQAGTSSMIRNYPGFPRGVSGAELAWRAYEQARVLGTQFIYGNPAVSLADEGGLRRVGLQDGSEVRARAVVIGTGVSYRRLQATGLESLVGAGVFYGAATVQAPGVSGQQVFVVGGGNSAGQAALHLSKYARQVSILVRSTTLAASMSQYLIREIGNTSNVDVRYGVDVIGGGGEGGLEHVRLRDRVSGAVRSEPAAGLFVLIGAEPFTGWLPEAVARDRWGYVLTGLDTGRHWPLARTPLLLETSLPGVFAVGDVRHGSVKRVASAVGEGSICIRLVHEYLSLAR